MAVEQRQQVVDQSRVRLVTSDRGLEDVRVADSLDAPQRTFLLQPIHHRLHAGVGGPSLLRQRFVNLADGTGTMGPQRFHDAELDAAQRRSSCHRPTTTMVDLTTYVVVSQAGD